MPVMAYSPVEQARLLRQPALAGFAREHGMTPAQAALAWLLHKDDVIAIPKAGRRAHVEENAAALGITLTDAQLRELDRLFPPPDGPTPLEML
jgi:aldehyde reductase